MYRNSNKDKQVGKIHESSIKILRFFSNHMGAKWVHKTTMMGLIYVKHVLMAIN